MIKLISIIIILYFSIACNAQYKIKGRYLGYQLNSTQNVSFINQQLIFIDNDTLKVNLRLPFDTITHSVTTQGIYYNCHLKEGIVYTITLEKICVSDIPESFNSYYRTNAIFRKKDCSKFKEIKKDTEYKYYGNYGHYVDIDGVLYKIRGLSPGSSCSF